MVPRGDARGGDLEPSRSTIEVAPERGGKYLNRKLGEVTRLVPHVNHPTLRVRVGKFSGSKDR